jgi:hypothetical protein
MVSNQASNKEKFMNKLVAVATSAITVAVLTLGSFPAMAGGLDVGINIGVPVYSQAPVYVEQPVYVQERPIYVQREYEGDWRERQARAHRWQHEQRGEQRYHENDHRDHRDGRDNERHEGGGEHHGHGD